MTFGILKPPELREWLRNVGMKEFILRPFTVDDDEVIRLEEEARTQHPTEDPKMIRARGVGRALALKLSREKRSRGTVEQAKIFKPTPWNWDRIFNWGFRIFVVVILLLIFLLGTPLRGEAQRRSLRVQWKDEGSILGTRGGGNLWIIDCTGAGIACTQAGATITVNVTGGGATGYQTIEDEGGGLTQRTILNFTGAGVTCADNVTKTDCDIPAGGSPTLDAILAAAGAASINSGDNAIVWNWQLTTASKNAFEFTENVAGTATGDAVLVDIATLAASTVHPLEVTSRGDVDGIRVGATDGILVELGTGGVDFGALLNYPTACSNTFVRAILDSPTCEAVVLTADVSGILPGANGGTNNAFMDFTGPATSLKTYTLPNATTTILTTNAAVTVAQGGTGLTAGTSGGVPYFNATSTMASSALLTANALVLGGGAGAAPSTPVGLGTTTTLLHGNAAGAPSYGAVDLANDVTGILDEVNLDANVVLDPRTITVAGTANEITSSAGAQDLSANRVWTLSLPATIDLGGKTSFEIPNAAAPVVDAFGEIAGDNDFYAAGRGVAAFFDGTSPTHLVGVLNTDTPTNGQVPTWQTGGTVLWVTPSGGGDTTKTHYIELDCTTPRSTSLAGNSFWTVTGLTDWDAGHWEFVKDVDGKIYCTTTIPNTVAGTPAAAIVLVTAANATTGVTRLIVGTNPPADGESLNPASLTNETAQDITVPATARLRKDVTFTLTNAPVALDFLIVEIFHEGANAADTLSVNTELYKAWLKIDLTQ